MLSNFVHCSFTIFPHFIRPASLHLTSFVFFIPLSPVYLSFICFGWLQSSWVRSYFFFVPLDHSSGIILLPVNRNSVFVFMFAFPLAGKGLAVHTLSHCISMVMFSVLPILPNAIKSVTTRFALKRNGFFTFCSKCALFFVHFFIIEISLPLLWATDRFDVQTLFILDIFIWSFIFH